MRMSNTESKYAISLSQTCLHRAGRACPSPRLQSPQISIVESSKPSRTWEALILAGYAALLSSSWGLLGPCTHGTTPWWAGRRAPLGPLRAGSLRDQSGPWELQSGRIGGRFGRGVLDLLAVELDLVIWTLDFVARSGAHTVPRFCVGHYGHTPGAAAAPADRWQVGFLTMCRVRPSPPPP
jgi:hypothetical protein